MRLGAGRAALSPVGVGRVDGGGYLLPARWRGGTKDRDLPL